MNNLDFTTQVLQELFIGQWETCGGVDDIVWKDGHSTTENEYSQINTRVAELQDIYDSQEYARNRKAEYDLLNQYELMFDDQQNGTTTWVDSINAIKAKYPKENT